MICFFRILFIVFFSSSLFGTASNSNQVSKSESIESFETDFSFPTPAPVIIYDGCEHIESTEYNILVPESFFDEATEIQSFLWRCIELGDNKNNLYSSYYSSEQVEEIIDMFLSYNKARVNIDNLADHLDGRTKVFIVYLKIVSNLIFDVLTVFASNIELLEYADSKYLGSLSEKMIFLKSFRIRDYWVGNNDYDVRFFLRLFLGSSVSWFPKCLSCLRKYDFILKTKLLDREYSIFLFGLIKLSLNIKLKKNEEQILSRVLPGIAFAILIKNNVEKFAVSDTLPDE